MEHDATQPDAPAKDPAPSAPDAENPHSPTEEQARENYFRVTDRALTPAAPETAAALQAVLDGRWPEVRARTRESMRPEMLTPLGPTMTEHRDLVLDHLRTLAADGIPKLGFRPEDGGTGDTGGVLTSFEMLGFTDLSLMVKAGVQWGLFGGAVSNLGDAEIRQQILPQVMSLELLGCFAMTEIGHGSDVQHLETTATYDADTHEFVVDSPTPSAQKAYIGGAGRDARMAAVFARLITPDLQTSGETLDHGVHCVLVPIRDEAGADLPGVTTGDHGHKGGLPGVDNGTILFDHVRVPRENLLNRFGAVAEDGTYTSPIDSDGARFFTMLGTLIRGRVSVGAAAGAAGRVATSLAVRYGLIRRQFQHPESGKGIPLLEYRAHQRRLMPLVAQAYAYACAQNAIISELNDFELDPDSFDDRRRRELESHAAGIKAAVTTFGNAAVVEARLACGGAGYMAENGLTTMRGDLDVFSTFEGDNVVLTQLVAKDRLTAYASEFGDMDQSETVAFVLATAADVVKEKVRASTLWQRVVDSVTDREETDLLDRGNQLELLTDREEHLVETAARRLREAEGGSGNEAFRAFNSAGDHVLECGRAHIDRWVFEQFAEAIETCEDDAARALLGELCDLFFLGIVVEHKGWFLEHNRLTTERTKAATANYNRLCTRLAGHSRTLVEAFGIPEFVLDVPMLREAGVDHPDAPDRSERAGGVE